MTTDGRKLLTILVPAYNEEECLPRAYEEISAVARTLPVEHEVLVIDNASEDRTGEIAEELCRRDRRWRYLRLSRNFTVEGSLAAGFRYAQGDAIITCYSDLQDPPGRIPDFVAKWLEGHDVVYGVRSRRPGDPAWRNLLVKIAYRLIHRLSEDRLPVDTGDFVLISRRVRDVLVGLEERGRYTRGLVHWVGMRRCALPYERRPRFAGKSKAPFFEILRFAITAVTSFSTRPLRILTIFGAIVVSFAAVLALVYVGGWFLYDPPPGITSTLVLLVANLGMMSLGFGILGEYLGRTYVETKRRPLWIVDRAVNLDVDDGPAGGRGGG